jgi:hypothetical protein
MKTYEEYVYYSNIQRWKKECDLIHEWCKQNCNHAFFVDPLSLSARVTFVDESDFVAFKIGY